MSVTLLHGSSCSIRNPQRSIQRRSPILCAQSGAPLQNQPRASKAAPCPSGALLAPLPTPLPPSAPWAPTAAALAPNAPNFRVGLRDALVEHVEKTPCAVTGTLPEELHGTLYRNGPARFDIHGERVKHWFDGEGKVIAVQLGPDGATYQSRFVDTLARQKERLRGKRLYAGLGGRPRGGFLGSLRGFLSKNVANTNVAFFGNKLLALYEGGRPYALDPETLETLGEEDFGGFLQPTQAASAHPRWHAPTGAMWSFKMQYGRENTIQLYKADAQGAVVGHTQFTLPYTTMVHDFCLTDTHAVFVLSPLVVDLPGVAMYLLGLKAMHTLPKIDPKAGSYVVAVPLADAAAGTAPTARIARFDTPVMVMHTVNAWDEGGDIVMDVCDFAGAQTLDAPCVMMGDKPLVRSMPKIRRLRLDAGGTVHTAFVGEAELEFPKVAPHVTHKAHTKIYGLQWPQGHDYVAAPAVYDVVTQNVTQVPMEKGCYACECVVISKKGAVREDQVYLASVVLDSRNATSALHVYDGESLTTGPVAQVALPQLVPHGFHGSWVPAQ